MGFRITALFGGGGFWYGELKWSITTILKKWQFHCLQFIGLKTYNWAPDCETDGPADPEGPMGFGTLELNFSIALAINPFATSSLSRSFDNYENIF